jgi:hypothetical protein
MKNAREFHSVAGELLSLRIFSETRRFDCFDACEMLRKAFPQLLFATSQGIGSDKKKPFSLANEFLDSSFWNA